MIDFVKQLAREAGAICKRNQQVKPGAEVSFKNLKELVTPTDREVERSLRETIEKHYPDHDILGEEEGATIRGGAFCWIIDPIDGTTSYYHGQPFYSVSIGLRQGNAMEAAVVYAPALDQLFHAVRGKGAHLNDQPIAVSTCDRLPSALLATGFACLRSDWEENNLEYFNRLMPEIRDIRRCGSAALDLAYVAAGKHDGFWELNLNLYDVAAGVLLVQEAGGSVCDFKGQEQYPQQGIVAANKVLLAKILPFLN